MLKIFGIFVKTGFMIWVVPVLYVVAMFAWFLFIPFVVIFVSLSFLCLMERGKSRKFIFIENGKWHLRFGAVVTCFLWLVFWIDGWVCWWFWFGLWSGFYLCLISICDLGLCLCLNSFSFFSFSFFCLCCCDLGLYLISIGDLGLCLCLISVFFFFSYSFPPFVFLWSGFELLVAGFVFL